MTATASPPAATSFGGIPSLNDVYESGTYLVKAANSVYSGTGQVLFSVDANGIYDPTGTMQWDFTLSGLSNFSITTGYPSYPAYLPTYPTSAGGLSNAITPTNAVSEICIFPCTLGINNKSYYVVFWAVTSDVGYFIKRYALREIKVTIGEAGSLSFPVDQILYDNSSASGNAVGSGLIVYSALAGPNSLTIAADAADCNGNRIIYTTENCFHVDGTSTTFYGTNLRKWSFPADGSSPLPSTASFYDQQLYPAYSPKAKIFTVAGEKYFSYISGDNLVLGDASRIILWDISEGTGLPGIPSFNDVSSYDIDYDAHRKNIFGFEHVNSSTYSNGFLYIDYQQTSVTDPGSDINNSGLAFINLNAYQPITLATATGAIATSYTLVPTPVGTTIGTGNYSYSDLELDKGGDLLMVKGFPSGAFGGSAITGTVSYLPSSAFGIAYTLPVDIASGCGGDYSVSNTLTVDGVNFYPLYLGKQIIGEDYTKWGPATAYTVTGTETWTAASNPSGIYTTTVTMLSNIVVAAGASLTIQGITVQMPPTSYITVLHSAPAPSTIKGGRLVLNGATLTATPGCDNTWGGVQVLGDPAQSQIPVSTSHQGELTMINGSMISRAKIGADVNTGGYISATKSTFEDNNYGVVFTTYRNFVSSSPSVEHNNMSGFNRCSFISNDATMLLNGVLIDIYGSHVNGIPVIGCDFENNTGVTKGTYGIYGADMGVGVNGYFPMVSLPGHTPCTFANFYYGIYHSVSDAHHVATIQNSVFTNNIIGIDLAGSIAPVVYNNTFNIPAPATPFFLPFVTTIQATGLLLYGATGFTVNNNTFQSSVTTTPLTQNVGILAWNVGGTDQVIHSNVFTGLGAGNISNYKNRVLNETGLWYECNNNTGNWMDIGVEGNDPTSNGIRYHQGYEGGSSSGQPAGNLFSTGNHFNLVNIPTDCLDIVYFYSSSGSPLEQPGVATVTANDFPSTLSKSPSSAPDACPSGGMGAHLPVYNGGGVIQVSANTDYTTARLSIMNNISYYLSDTDSVSHRDSVYYWAAQLHDAYGDLMTTGLLVEDSLVDSAYVMFNSIATNYNLDGPEYNEFTTWGNELLQAQVLPLLQAGVPSAYYGTLADTSTTDSAIVATQKGLLVDVFNNGHMWARVKAENMLAMLDTVLYDSLLNGNPDTLLFPTIPPPPCKGVLAVTEMSNGPADKTGCNYGELIVADCGTCNTPTVDIRGWIIDDNSGEFNLDGCTLLAGITQSHYRLAYDPVWASVPVGSMIIVYNADNNCYNLPETFTVTPGAGLIIAGGALSSTTTAAISAGNTYYVPLGGTEANPLGKPHTERFKFALDSTVCNYVVDTITTADTTYDSTYYRVAADWQNTINLDPNGDAFQVRCPRCGRNMANKPAFYHGIGYGADSGPGQFVSVAKDASSLGGPVINNTGGGYKYCFNGSTADDLGDASKWVVLAADAAGAPPPTVGNVNKDFGQAAQQKMLNLPCCDNRTHGSDDRKKNSPATGGTTQAISNLVVYPIPATMTLSFRYSQQANITIKLLDVTGRLMDEQTLQNSSTTSFNVENYIPGIYLYQVITNNTTQTGKVVIGK